MKKFDKVDVQFHYLLGRRMSITEALYAMIEEASDDETAAIVSVATRLKLLSFCEKCNDVFSYEAPCCNDTQPREEDLTFKSSETND